MLCCALLRGALCTSGTPVLRDSARARVSLGTCQNTGLPMVSSAFLRLMSPSAPTRFMTILTLLASAFVRSQRQQETHHVTQAAQLQLGHDQDHVSHVQRRRNP